MPQAAQRGRAARAKLRADKAAADAKVAELDAQLATAEVEAVHFDGTEQEQTAATKLQAVQRGRRARTDVEQLRKQRESAAAASAATTDSLADAELASDGLLEASSAATCKSEDTAAATAGLGRLSSGEAPRAGAGGVSAMAGDGYYDTDAMRRAPGSDEMAVKPLSPNPKP